MRKLSSSPWNTNVKDALGEVDPQEIRAWKSSSRVKLSDYYVQMIVFSSTTALAAAKSKKNFLNYLTTY